MEIITLSGNIKNNVPKDINAIKPYKTTNGDDVPLSELFLSWFLINTGSIARSLVLKLINLEGFDDI